MHLPPTRRVKHANDDDTLFSLPCKVTYTQRFWRFLGFRYKRKALPEGVHINHPGWVLTNVHHHFTWADRIRLLLSGNISIEIRQATSREVNSSINATNFYIRPPYSKGMK